jgi:hypothetical protein
LQGPNRYVLDRYAVIGYLKDNSSLIGSDKVHILLLGKH